jgi:PAS domain S-box-containing protein
MRIRANFVVLNALLIILAVVCAGLCFQTLTGDASALHANLGRGGGWGALLAAIGCAFLAWLLFCRYLGDRKDAERRLLQISRILSEASDERFFTSLARHLALHLLVDCAMIAETVGDEQDRVRTIAIFAFGAVEDVIEFPLTGTPCGDALEQGFCFCGTGVRKRYPDDRILAIMEAEGFVGMPLKDAQGTIIGLMAVIHRQPLVERETIESVFRIVAIRAAAELDRRRGETRMREMAERTRLVTDSVPASIAYVDANLCYRFVNRRYLDLFCLTGRDVIGLNVVNVLRADIYAGLEEFIVKALTGREVAFTTRIETDGGRTMYLETSYIPHRDKGGRIPGIFIQHVDITSRVLGEQALRKSEERYRTVFDTTGNATFIVEEDTTVSFVNREFTELTGYTREEAEGKLGWAVFVSPGDRDRLLAYHRARRVYGDSAPSVYECVVLRKDGTERNVLAQVGLIPGTHQTVASFLDITLRKEMEIELQAQLRFLKVLLDTIPSPVFYKNSAGAYLGCNRAFEAYIGMPAEQIIGKTVHDLSPPDLAQRYAVMDERLFREQGVQVYEAEVRFADGSRHDVVFSKATFTGTDGGVGGLVGVILDVSEQKRAELLLAKDKLALEMIASEAPLADVLDFLCRNAESLHPEARCSVLLLDADGRLRHAAAPSIPQEYVSAVDGTLIGPRVGSCGAAAFTGRRIVACSISTDPLWADYSRLPLSFGLRACWTQPILGSTGAVLGTFSVFWTSERAPAAEELQLLERTAHLASIAIERSRAKHALRESEERFHQLFAQHDDAIILFRTDNSIIIDVNRSAEDLTGFRCDELRGREPSRFIATEGFRQLMDAVTASSLSQGFQLDKVVCIRKDGRQIFVSLRGKILRLRDEFVVNCSIRDITDKMRLEEEIRVTQAKLIHADKMASLGMLASSIAHEINNPNNYIAVNASLLAEAWQDAVPILRDFGAENGEFAVGGLPFSELEELAPRLFTGIMEGSRRIATIVNDMKDYVRTDKSGLSGRIDVNRIIRAASTILWNLIHRYTDNFRLDLRDELPAATGNSQQIEQVVINLIMNALQALPDKRLGVFVETGADAGAGAVIIRVRDEGKGMDEAVLARATEPFFSTRIEEGGTGLGLYITASIIKEHGGSLHFQSVPGKGTTATIRLPTAS